jgi:hypothetical protein
MPYYEYAANKCFVVEKSDNLVTYAHFMLMLSGITKQNWPEPLNKVASSLGYQTL